MTVHFCEVCECELIQHETPACGVFYVCPYCGEPYHFIEKRIVELPQVPTVKTTKEN